MVIARSQAGWSADKDWAGFMLHGVPGPIRIVGSSTCGVFIQLSARASWNGLPTTLMGHQRNLSGLFTALEAWRHCCGRHFLLDWTDPLSTPWP